MQIKANMAFINDFALWDHYHQDHNHRCWNNRAFGKEKKNDLFKFTTSCWPSYPLPRYYIYHFNVIYNHAKSSFSRTVDTELALRVTAQLVAQLEKAGFVNSYFHDRDHRLHNGLMTELERVLEGSWMTILLLTPGFMKDCLPQYLCTKAFRDLLTTSNLGSRLIVVSIGQSDHEVISHFPLHHVICFAEDWEQDTLAWKEISAAVLHSYQDGKWELDGDESFREFQGHNIPLSVTSPLLYSLACERNDRDSSPQMANADYVLANHNSGDNSFDGLKYNTADYPMKNLWLYEDNYVAQKDCYSELSEEFSVTHDMNLPVGTINTPNCNLFSRSRILNNEKDVKLKVSEDTSKVEEYCHLESLSLRKVHSTFQHFNSEEHWNEHEQSIISRIESNQKLYEGCLDTTKYHILESPLSETERILKITDDMFRTACEFSDINLGEKELFSNGDIEMKEFIADQEILSSESKKKLYYKTKEGLFADERDRVGIYEDRSQWLCKVQDDTYDNPCGEFKLESGNLSCCDRIYSDREEFSPTDAESNVEVIFQEEKSSDGPACQDYVFNEYHNDVQNEREAMATHQLCQTCMNVVAWPHTPQNVHFKFCTCSALPKSKTEASENDEITRNGHTNLCKERYENLIFPKKSDMQSGTPVVCEQTQILTMDDTDGGLGSISNEHSFNEQLNNYNINNPLQILAASESSLLNPPISSLTNDLINENRRDCLHMNDVQNENEDCLPFTKLQHDDQSQIFVQGAVSREHESENFSTLSPGNDQFPCQLTQEIYGDNDRLISMVCEPELAQETINEDRQLLPDINITKKPRCGFDLLQNKDQKRCSSPARDVFNEDSIEDAHRTLAINKGQSPINLIVNDNMVNVGEDVKLQLKGKGEERDILGDSDITLLDNSLESCETQQDFLSPLCDTQLLSPRNLLQWEGDSGYYGDSLMHSNGSVDSSNCFLNLVALNIAQKMMCIENLSYMAQSMHSQVSMLRHKDPSTLESGVAKTSVEDVLGNEKPCSNTSNDQSVTKKAQDIHIKDERMNSFEAENALHQSMSYNIATNEMGNNVTEFVEKSDKLEMTGCVVGKEVHSTVEGLMQDEDRFVMKGVVNEIGDLKARPQSDFLSCADEHKESTQASGYSNLLASDNSRMEVEKHMIKDKIKNAKKCDPFTDETMEICVNFECGIDLEVEASENIVAQRIAADLICSQIITGGELGNICETTEKAKKRDTANRSDVQNLSTGEQTAEEKSNNHEASSESETWESRDKQCMNKAPSEQIETHIKSGNSEAVLKNIDALTDYIFIPNFSTFNGVSGMLDLGRQNDWSDNIVAECLAEKIETDMRPDALTMANNVRETSRNAVVAGEGIKATETQDADVFLSKVDIANKGDEVSLIKLNVIFGSRDSEYAELLRDTTDSNSASNRVKVPDYTKMVAVENIVALNLAKDIQRKEFVKTEDESLCSDIHKATSQPFISNAVIDGDEKDLFWCYQTLPSPIITPTSRELDILRTTSISTTPTMTTTTAATMTLTRIMAETATTVMASTTLPSLPVATKPSSGLLDPEVMGDKKTVLCRKDTSDNVVAAGLADDLKTHLENISTLERTRLSLPESMQELMNRPTSGVSQSDCASVSFEEVTPGCGTILSVQTVSALTTTTTTTTTTSTAITTMAGAALGTKTVSSCDHHKEKTCEDWLLPIYKGVCHALSKPDMPYLG